MAALLDLVDELPSTLTRDDFAILAGRLWFDHHRYESPYSDSDLLVTTWQSPHSKKNIGSISDCLKVLEKMGINFGGNPEDQVNHAKDGEEVRISYSKPDDVMWDPDNRLHNDEPTLTISGPRNHALMRAGLYEAHKLQAGFYEHGHPYGDMAMRTSMNPRALQRNFEHLSRKGCKELLTMLCERARIPLLRGWEYNEQKNEFTAWFEGHTIQRDSDISKAQCALADRGMNYTFEQNEYGKCSLSVGVHSILYRHSVGLQRA